MPHIFSFENIEVLEKKDRLRWLPLEPLINLINKNFSKEKREIAYEIGPGAGYFTIPLSKIFKKIYAMEISKDMMNYLENKINKKEIKNINFILSKNPSNVTEQINLIFFGLVLHELDNPIEFLDWASLNTEKVIIIDWKKEKTSEGPPVDDRISQKKAKEMLKKSGFNVKNYNFYPYHYLLLGIKKLKVQISTNRIIR